MDEISALVYEGTYLPQLFQVICASLEYFTLQVIPRKSFISLCPVAFPHGPRHVPGLGAVVILAAVSHSFQLPARPRLHSAGALTTQLVPSFP